MDFGDDVDDDEKREIQIVSLSLSLISKAIKTALDASILDNLSTQKSLKRHRKIININYWDRAGECVSEE